MKGEMKVFSDLPEPYRQGLFATAATYPVAVRMAVGPGELLSDAVSTHRGMAIKVFGADGPKLAGHSGDTQDFVLATGPAFPQPDAAGFLKSLKGLESATSKSEGFKQAVSTAARVTNAAIGKASGMLDFFGHPPIPPLADTPVEDASKIWSEDDSPYVAAARIILPPQDAYGLERQKFMDDVMSFQPSHSLEAHRPLGSLMRARLATYPRLSSFRHARNGDPQIEPQALSDIPD